MAKNPTTLPTPSLFVHVEDGTGIDMVVDLAKVCMVSKRPNGGGYYVNMGGQSIPCGDTAGLAIRGAWIAFQGKFTPGVDS